MAEIAGELKEGGGSIVQGLKGLLIVAATASE